MQVRNIAAIILGAAFGLAAGVGAYTFVYAKGASYLTDRPEACANCHVMSEQYAGWIRSSHRAAAGCNDCHTPAGFFRKYGAKASNGFWHSYAFTSGPFPEPIRIKPHNRRTAEEKCRLCHQEIVEAVEGIGGAAGETSCINCHPSVGHPS